MLPSTLAQLRLLPVRYPMQAPALRKRSARSTSRPCRCDRPVFGECLPRHRNAPSRVDGVQQDALMLIPQAALRAKSERS
jgi:hypothetical protein